MKGVKFDFYIVGHRLIAEPNGTVTFSARPFQHLDQKSATREASRLAYKCRDKHFVIMGGLHGLQWNPETGTRDKLRHYQYTPMSRQEEKDIRKRREEYRRQSKLAAVPLVPTCEENQQCTS